jgi:hypothetical protein
VLQDREFDDLVIPVANDDTESVLDFIAKEDQERHDASGSHAGSYDKLARCF